MKTSGHWIVMTSDGFGTAPWECEPFECEEYAQEYADELVTDNWFIKQAWPEYVPGEGR